MEKITVCFYKAFGGYANYYDKVWYNCPICKNDEKNKECKYYIPVTICIFNVISNLNNLSDKNSK
jgi:hypothetical protein